MQKLKPTAQAKCDWCADKATWRTSGIDVRKNSCTGHKQHLQAYEIKNVDTSEMSEADRQSWGRYA